MKNVFYLLIISAFLSCEKGGPSPEPQATCSDGILNGDEVSIDCGGSCNACEEPGGEITSYDGLTLVWNDEFDYEGAPSAEKMASTNPSNFWRRMGEWRTSTLYKTAPLMPQ